MNKSIKFFREIEDNRKNKGFSMAEMLIVVALIILTLSIAIPNVLSYKRNMELMHADDVAREIFLSAQNELVYQKSVGQLTDIYTSIVGSCQAANNHSDNQPSLYYMKSDSDAMRRILGEKKLDAISAGGYYYIEVEPSSANVYSVFYTEKDITWDELNATSNGLRNKEGRRKYYSQAVVGYYAAKLEDLEYAEAEHIKLGNLSIINSEELYVEFDVYVRNDVLSNDTKLTLTLLDEQEHSQVDTISLSTPANKNGLCVEKGPSEFFDENGVSKLFQKYTVRKLIDSMEDAYRFKSRFSEFSLGSTITAAVSFKYEGVSEGKNVKEEISGSAVSNSSFAQVIIDSTGFNSVGIRYIRHLYNIQDYASKASYIQVATLDFEADNYSWSEGKYFNNTNEATKDSALNPLKGDGDVFSKYHGVTLPKESEYLGNGNRGNTIKNFKSDRGIFSEAVSCKLSEIYVVNHKIEMTDLNTPVGGLIGNIQGGSIMNCQVYQENGESFIKTSEGSAGTLYVGGLAGKINGVAIEKSCAAIPVVSASADGFCGGLVGFAEGAAFSKCYGNTTDLKGKYAGGFAGSLSNCDVRYCYAVAESYSNDTENAAGFCADMKGGSLEQSYALIGSINTRADSKNRMALIQDDSGPKNVNNCYFNYDGKFAATQTKVGESAAYNEIVEKLSSEDVWAYDYNANGSIKSLEFSKPFHTEGNYEYMENAAYTCLRIKGMPHYGNWPDASCTIEYLPNLESIGLAEEVSYKEGVKERLEGFHSRKILTSGSIADSGLRDYVWEGNYPEKTVGEEKVKYVFKCWKVSGTDTVYYPGDSIEVSGNSLVLMAQWAPGITITYDTNANGKAKFFGQESYDDPRLRYKGEEVEILFTDDEGKQPIHKERYQFIGWNYKNEKRKTPPRFTYVLDGNESDWQKKHIEVQPEDGTHSITLYALWENPPKESHLKIRVNDVYSQYEELGLTLKGGISVEYAKKPGDYFVNAKTGQYDLLLRGNETGIKVIVDSSGARFVQNGETLQLLDLYTLKVRYRLNGTYQNWIDFNDTKQLKSLFSLDHIDIDSESFNLADIVSVDEGVYESPVMLPGSEFSIYVKEPSQINEAANICKTENPDLQSIATKSIYLRPSSGNVVKGPVTVYADYCSIEFRSPDEWPVKSLPPKVIVRGGSNYRCPEDVLESESGKGIFLGWSSLGDGETGRISVSPGGYIYIDDNKELILYARWKDSIKVTYETNFYKKGHDDVPECNINDIIKKVKGDAFYEAKPLDEGNYACTHLVYTNQSSRIHTVLPTKLQRAGYYFVGWGTSPYAYDGGTTYWPGSQVALEDDLVLYAQWAYNKNYTIVYLMSEEEFSSGVSNTTFPETNSVVTLALNRYSRAGKEFTGWHGYINGSANQNDPNYKVDFDAGAEYSVEQLKACKEPNSNLIILYGSWKDLEEKDSYQVEFKLDKMKPSQYSLYAYAGQNYTAVLECEGGYRPPDTISVLVKGMELDPKSDYNWNPTTRKVTIYADAIRGPVTIIGAAIPEKHSFSYLNVKENGDTEILYKEDVQYNTYNAIKSIEEIGAEEHIPAGCLFTGWNTKKDGSGTMYKPGDSIFIQGEVNLYACWKKSDVVGAGIYNGYLFYYYKNKSSSSDHYYLARGETQTLEDGETLVVINDGGQVHFTKNSSGYTYYYCIMLQKDKSLSDYTIEFSRNDGSNYETEEGILPLYTDSSDSLKEAFEDNKTSVFEYADSAYDYYYFKDTVSGKPEITNIKITENGEDGKSAIFDFANSFRPTNSQSESISGPSDYFKNSKKYPKVDVYNGSVPRIDRSYANFFKNKDCRSKFRVHLDANNEKYVFNSINLVDEKGISITTRNNLILGIEEKDYIFNPDAMAELRSGTYTVIFDYSDYQNDPSFELHVYDEDLVGYRYIQMEIESLMAYCPNGSERYYTQFADVAFYGDEERISQYKFEDASCVYLNGEYTDSWLSSNKYEDISMIIDNNPRTKMCSYQKKASQNGASLEKESGIKLVIDVGDGYQFSPNIYGYTGLITAGDSEGYPWRMPNDFSFSGTNDSLKNPTWTPIAEQSLYNAREKLEEENNKGQDSNYVKPDNWLNNVPFYLLKNKDDNTYINETDTKNENTTKLRNLINQYLPKDVLGTGYNMQPTPVHCIKTYSLTYDTNAPEGANITWYDPQHPKDPESKNQNLVDKYGDQVIGFCIPQWKDDNGKTVKYFLGWSKDKNAKEADYTSGSHINLITNTTLYAVWSEISPTFALTYHANDSESAPAVNMPVNIKGSGKCKISSLIPEREGYKFIGWIWLGDVDNDHKIQDDPFQKDNLGLYQPSDSILLNQNVTLYARWVKSKCVTVIAPGCKITSSGWTMGSNGYKNYVPVRSSCSFTFSVEEGVEFKSISVKNKNGESISDFNYHYNEGEDTYYCEIPKVKEDLTVTIEVETKKFNVQVTGVDSIILQNTHTEIKRTENRLSFEVLYGETAAFYFEAPDSSKPLVSVSGTTGAIVTKEYYDNADYYLCRIPKVYENLNLSVVEGIQVVLKSSADATYSTTVYIPKGDNSVLPTADMVGFLAPEGQRFAGWAYSEGGKVKYPGGVAFDATELENETTPILYPCWVDEDTCTITIDYGYENKQEIKVVKRGSRVVLDIPEREDWIFDGWEIAGSNIGSSGFVANSETMTVTATWKRICKVWFNGNGGTPFEDVRIVASGSALGELPKAVWGEGEKILLHWTTPDGEGATENMVITSDIVLTAEWVDAVKYHLDPDHQEEYVCSDTKANENYQTLAYDSISGGYTRDDALFIGWANSPNLRDSDVKYYREGDTVSDRTADLYAVWLSGTLYFERQCQGNHEHLKKDLTNRELWPWREESTDKTLFYRITLDLNQEDKQFSSRQIGSPSNEDKTELYISPVFASANHGVWWNYMVIPDTITGGYKNWEVKVYIPDHKQSAPQYYPNESNGKSPMIEGKSKTWSIGSSKLGSKNCASYGIRDDGIVEVTISFGKIKEGKYLYQKTIPFGKAVNVDEIKKDDSDNENIVIFPYSPAPTALQEFTGVTETPEVTDTTEVTETQETPNTSEVQEVTNIPEITEVTVP